LFLRRPAHSFAEERRHRHGEAEDEMGGFSIWHWLLFGIVALLLFGGKGKISDIMGDFAKGIKSFKKGMQDDDETLNKPSADMKILPPGEAVPDKSENRKVV
jgi:sec-independent protein translocase protein TatA